MTRLESFYKGKNILVTGHTGFKGAWLSEWLLKMGAEVTGYALKPADEQGAFNLMRLASRMKHHLGDVRDRQAFSQVLASQSFDAIFHLAAQPLVRESYRQPLETCETNILGACHLMEAARTFQHPCSLIVITTDKCYENREEPHRAYAESDSLGGQDLYSASKAAVELIVHAYRASFYVNSPVQIATARAGNVIGGGDRASERIIPDAVRAFEAGKPLIVRNPASTRPWQHVLEPLSGYLCLGALLQHFPEKKELRGAFNFGPEAGSNKSVQELLVELQKHFLVKAIFDATGSEPPMHEAGLLNLDSGKASLLLDWKPVWKFQQTIQRTAQWYEKVRCGDNPQQATLSDIDAYEKAASALGFSWSCDNL